MATDIKEALYLVPGYVRKDFPNKAYYGFDEDEYTCDEFEVLTCANNHHGMALK